MNPWFFYIAASITVLFVMAMLLQKNPLSGALCLIGSFFGMAALYVLLGAHFVAVLQILVYAGAIMVLFIFVIMMLNLNPAELKTKKTPFLIVAASVLSAAILCIYAGYFIKHMDFMKKIFVEEMRNPTGFEALPDQFGTAQSVGHLLFSSYALPFEMTGLLLLIGIVGAVLLGRKEKTK